MTTKTRSHALSGFALGWILLGLTPAPAQIFHTFGSGGNTFQVEFLAVGNPNNPDRTYAFTPSPRGSVAYEYQIGKFEVSRDMIQKANAVGGLGITLHDMSIAGANGPNHPATGVSWFEAASFVNWLNESKGYQKAYNVTVDAFGGAHTPWSAAEAWQVGGENLFRHKDAQYFLPSEDEWFKAAYYDPTTGGYVAYPTGSDVSPAQVTGGTAAGTAVYGNLGVRAGPAEVSNAGGLSLYGTMGQGGNVWEWTETAYTDPNNDGTKARVVSGGYWAAPVHWMDDAARESAGPSLQDSRYGFRVASLAPVPEPAEWAATMGLGMMGFVIWRKWSARR